MAVSTGARLGPYEILEPLGSGGMGEVYRARDTRLEREVAVKVLRPEVASDPDRLRRFEREARTVAALNHPHILTVHDVGTHEGTPYVVTELLEGETLRQVLKSRSPTRKQVLGFAVQIARGLAAAHDKDIVHRDLKPENVFLTTDGRIKILDFGLAKLTARESDLRSADTLGASEGHSTSPGVILGTVAYMSPEQTRALPLDPRSDIFSFGVVLYEMLAHKHPFLRDTAPATLSAILNDTPPDLVSLGRGIPPALGSLVQRCLEKERGERFRGTHDLALALEAVLQAPSGAAALQEVEERSPYPGLSAFTERDAAVFFGREREVEELWGRIRGRQLLAVIGPSGAGKSSFVRAGVVAHRPPGWKALVMTPGAHPFRALGRALGPELAGDTEALGLLADVEEPDTAVDLVRRWRRSDAEGLLVVDQLEELFTQSRPQVQEGFAALLGRLARDADVHVLLSLRDDFLIRCCEQEPLAPVVRGLTVLLALKPEDLRRAVEEPARERGYRFEDEALVEEVITSVEGARGALPLLAFAVSQLWEKRDRAAKRLTRAAYEEIGGVAGALAQHAEHTLERIGLEREPIVRELFRNLVTAQWTRAAADREEILSVLPDPEAGARVLDQLIDARLLTAYEVQVSVGGSSEPAEQASRHRIEVVHESLLRAWPRLVRWQAQDEEGAVLRDQLKQAARLWEEKGRPDDLLWTGTSEREFELWQDRYPGRLTALEDDFARAMVDRTRRRRRLRRAAVATLVAGLAAVATVIGILWRRSVAQERRAEAAGLFSLAQHRLEEHPTEALAYAMASFERADDLPVRHLALEALWRGPTEFRLPTRQDLLEFSPDGRWLAAVRPEGGWALWPSDGGPPTPLEGESAGVWWTRFSRKGDRILGHMDAARETLGIWSVPDGRLVRSFSTGGDTVFFGFSPDGKRILTAVARPRDGHGELEWRLWPLAGGEPAFSGRVDVAFETLYVFPDVNPSWSRVIWADGRVARVAPLEGGRLNASAPASLGHAATVSWVTFGEGGRKAVTSSDRGNRIDIWSLEHQPPEPLRTLLAPKGLPGQAAGFMLSLDSSGSRLSGVEGVQWDLAAPPDAEPIRVQGCFPGRFVPPRDRWLATDCGGFTSFWPLDRDYPRILRGHTQSVMDLAFTPDGRWLVSSSLDNSLRLWPMRPGVAVRSRILQTAEGAARNFGALSVAPDGSFVSAANSSSEVMIVPLDGGPVRRLGLIDDLVATTAVGPGRHLVAAGAQASLRKQGLVYVWDPATGDRRVLDAGDAAGVWWLRFESEEVLLAAYGPRLRRWSLAGAAPRVADEIDFSRSAAGGEVEIKELSPDGREALLSDQGHQGRLWVEDLATHATREVVWSGRQSGWVRFDPTGERVVSIDRLGAIRVGSARGGEPHLLLRQHGWGPLVVSPDGQWIASGGEDGTIRLWPMPDLSKPPLHTLPHDDLLAKLRSLTNLRAVRDSTSPTGWKIEAGPFPGWEEVPEW